MTSLIGLPFCTVIVRGSNSNCLAVILISTGGCGLVWLWASAGAHNRTSQNGESNARTKAHLLRSNQILVDIDNFSSTVPIRIGTCPFVSLLPQKDSTVPM